MLTKVNFNRTNMSYLETLRTDKIVPVVVIDDATHALPLARSLEAAGLNNIEITLRTPAGIEAVEIVARETGLCVGAGTVLSIEQAGAAGKAGASFLVSPGTNPEVVLYCQDKNIPILPGACTPTEIEQATSLGLDTVKFFPAEAAGGASFLKAISAPYANVSFVPTGGINADNFREYAALPSVVACGTSWIVDKKLINAQDWGEITRRCETLKALLANNL
jgi:Entner-Doudoroff aldolase